jgi:hypothetical protein
LAALTSLDTPLRTPSGQETRMIVLGNVALLVAS